MPHVRTRCLLVTATVALSAMTGLAEDAPTSRLMSGPLDEGLFRAGLRERGLTDWLDQYLADVPPVDNADATLRRREALLEQAARPGVSDVDRARRVRDAHELLTGLLVDHPHHPAHLRWQLESARDLLERIDPNGFNALLLYDLPGRDRARSARLAGSAIERLEALQKAIATEWSAIEAMDASTLDAVADGGSLQRLESLETRSAMLLAWARLYHALAAKMPADARRQAMADLLMHVTERTGWTESPDPARRCGAEVIGAIAARYAGRFDDANRLARSIIDSYGQIRFSGDRDRLQWSGLLAVLEQIRIERDRGQIARALDIVKQAREWADRARAEDDVVARSLALVHRSVLAAQGAATTRPAAGGFLEPADALAPLAELAGRSTAHRDGLYATLAGTLSEAPVRPESSPFQLQLLLGAALADSRRQSNGTAVSKERMRQRVADVAQRFRSLPAGVESATRGELLWLIGRSQYALGAHLEAANALADLVEQWPEHDRSPRAAEQAAAIAQAWLKRDPSGSREATAAFVRAVRVLRKRLPDSPQARQLQFFLAVALERQNVFAEAAREYAAVAPDDPRALLARLGQVRCLRKQLRDATAAGTTDEATQTAQAQAVVDAARSAAEVVTRQPAPDDQRRVAAEIVLLLAAGLNHPLIRQPGEALDVLADFEKRFGDEPALIGPVLRERVLAYRQLKRLTEARRVVARFLETDPDRAGAVMANLLEAMRTETQAAADRGDTAAVESVAAEAVELAGMLLAWSDDRPGGVSPRERLTIRIWQADGLRDAGRIEDALDRFTACQDDGAEILTRHAGLRFEVQLGRADCLLALDRPADALLLYAEVGQRTAEHAPAWWHAFVGNLRCHARLGHNATGIARAIRQQRHLAPDLGGPRWHRALEAIEQGHPHPTTAPAND